MHATANQDRPPVDGPLAALLVAVRFRLRRLDRRRLLAIGLAVMAAAITQTALRRASAIEAGLGQRAPTVVAAVELTPGTVIRGEQLGLEMWPIDLIPAGALADVSDAAGMTVRSHIFPGEPVVTFRATSGRLGLQATEVAITLSQPLAKPPLEIGQIVQLVGVRGGQESFTASASLISSGRIINFTDEAITVAVDDQSVSRLLEHQAVGTVEVVITPQRG